MSSPTPVIHSDPEILGGTPVFVGTRVPFRNLIDYLERGHGLDEFLDEFSSVSREHAVAALEAAYEAMTAGARPAQDLALLQDVHLGLADLEAGRVVSHEEARARLMARYGS